MSPLRTRALIAGLLYFSTHLTSVAAVVVYGGALTAPQNLATSPGSTAVLWGVALDAGLALGCVGTALALLPVLVRVAPSLGHAFLSLRAVEAAVIVAGAMPMLALVWLASGNSLAGAGLVPDALVGLHQASFLLGQGLIISVNSIIIGYVVWRHRIVLPAIGLLGMAGGVVVLTSNLLQLFEVLPLNGTIAGLMAVPVFAFEIWFAGYLVVRGFGPQVAELHTDF